MVRELFEAPKISLDKAPVLRGAFERLAAGCGEGMKSLCVSPSSFMLNAISVGTTWDLIEGYEDGICGIYYSSPWDERIVIGLDRRLAFSLTEAIFGGDGTEPPLSTDRPFSTVEVKTMRRIFDMVAQELEEQLAPMDRTNFVGERVETRIDFSTIGMDDDPAVMAQLVAQVFEGGGRMFVIIPQSALMPFRRKLERERSTEPAHVDPTWSRQFMNEVGRADVQLDAVLEGPSLPLAALLELRVNQVMRLPAAQDTLLTLESCGEPMFRCRLGQSAGQFTVRIEGSARPASLAGTPGDPE